MASTNRKYFGNVDAAEEDLDALDRHFVAHPLFQELIAPDNPEGAQVIVGPKGCGKTALGRIALKRSNGIKWLRNEKSKDFRFSIPEEIPRSGILMRMIRVFLIEQLNESLLENGVIKQTDFNKLWGGLKKVGANFAKSTEVNTGLIKFDPSKFFDIGNQGEFDKAWDNVISFLKKTIPKKDIFIVLDDVDTYFLTLEEKPRFVEGLFRAVNELNSIVGLNIYCLMFVKQGVWRTLFNKPEEYDRIKYIIDFFSWDINQCSAVLAGRIADKHDLEFNPPTSLDTAVEYLKLELSGNKSKIKKCFEKIFEFSANGPRDVLDICNNIKKTYPNKKSMKIYLWKEYLIIQRRNYMV